MEIMECRLEIEEMEEYMERRLLEHLLRGVYSRSGRRRLSY
jgi:hypothetical protein